MSIVSLVIAPTIAKIHYDKIQNNRKEKIESLMMMDSTTRENQAASVNNVSNAEETATEDPQIKQLVSELKKDGLITTPDYSVSVKAGRLYINEVRQKNAVNNKYKNIFEGKEDFSFEVKANKK
jgi:uncharacterized protein with WD repeat